jgi:hypothetical protein
MRSPCLCVCVPVSLKSQKNAALCVSVCILIMVTTQQLSKSNEYKKNSVAFSLQTNNTDRETPASGEVGATFAVRRYCVVSATDSYCH